MQKTYQIHSFELGPMENLIHVAIDTATAKAAIFDPGYEADFLLEFLHTQHSSLDKIIFTHAHYDHIGALQEILSHQAVPVYISKAELDFYGKPVANVQLVHDKDTLRLGETHITALFTPGHSAGSTCYRFSDDVITGDTVFIYGCGHCKLPGANPGQLFDSLNYLKQQLPAEITVHTSHTYGISHTSSWQQQLEGNPFLHFEDKDKFIAYREQHHDAIRSYPMQPILKEDMLEYL